MGACNAYAVQHVYVSVKHATTRQVTACGCAVNFPTHTRHTWAVMRYKPLILHPHVTTTCHTTFLSQATSAGPMPTINTSQHAHTWQHADRSRRLRQCHTRQGQQLSPSRHGSLAHNTYTISLQVRTTHCVCSIAVWYLAGSSQWWPTRYPRQAVGTHKGMHGQPMTTGWA